MTGQAQTPGQALPGPWREQDHVEWLRWMEARGYEDGHAFGWTHMANAFHAGAQVRDLAAAQERPAPGGFSGWDGSTGVASTAPSWLDTLPDRHVNEPVTVKSAPDLAAALAALADEMHAAAGSSGDSLAAALHGYASRIRLLIGPQAVLQDAGTEEL